MLALVLAAAALPVLGLLPHALAEKLSSAALAFTGGHPFSHTIHYFAWTNLKGVCISVAIGALVYVLFTAARSCGGRTAEPRYLDRWPGWLSLERCVYRPVFGMLDRILRVLCRAVCDSLDAVLLLLRRTVLRDTRQRVRRSAFSAPVRAIARSSGRSEEDVADKAGTYLRMVGQLSNSLSFALLMTCLGLCIVLVCLLRMSSDLTLSKRAMPF